MKTRAITAFVFLLLSGQFCYADGRFEGWYQIEMIVYSRPQQNSVERWPKNIELSYPLNWQQLLDPNASPATPEDPGQEAASDAVELAHTPFYRLPRELRNLNSVSARLSEHAGFKVLFHEAWRQIVVSQERSPAVLIVGGDAFGEHNELEGSVTIHVSRYLHINTDLWLSEFQTNAGQSRNQWPALPQQPPKRLAQQASRSGTSLLEERHNTLGGANTFSFTKPSSTKASSHTALTDFLAAPYLPREIITMHQSRRMRSDELHYLDHPRMGLLIKILPYTPPQTEPDEQASEH
jgi:hypothetical protein